mgnify:CR=1 FL=1
MEFSIEVAPLAGVIFATMTLCCVICAFNALVVIVAAKFAESFVVSREVYFSVEKPGKWSFGDDDDDDDDGGDSGAPFLPPDSGRFQLPSIPSEN